MNETSIQLGGAEKFSPAVSCFEKIQLNPQKLKFILINEPSISDIEKAIIEYSEIRRNARWNELNEVWTKSGQNLLVGFKSMAKRFKNIHHEKVISLLDVETYASAVRKLQTMSVEEQKYLLAEARPTSIEEALALYLDSKHDETGYRYLIKILRKSTRGFDYFEKIINELISCIKKTDYTLGSPKIGFHQRRILEFLGFSRKNNWILFPFLTSESGLPLQRALAHFANCSRYTAEEYAPSIVNRLTCMASEIGTSRVLPLSVIGYIRGFSISTNISDIGQVSKSMLERCLELADNGREDGYRPQAYARSGYNQLINIFNSQYSSHGTIPIIAKKSKAPSIKEFVNLNHLFEKNPELQSWGYRLSKFLEQKEVEASSLHAARSHCEDIAFFILQLPSPPHRPEDTRRSHINSFNSIENTFCNFLNSRHDNNTAKNARIATIKLFFDYVCDCQRLEPAHPLERFVNPVDLAHDKYKTRYHAGSVRKSIPAQILELGREILVEDDYAWSKSFELEWMVAPNLENRALEKVWCPSAAICLYTLLSIPLRSLQGRLLDSGAGDELIFDFESSRMIENKNQLPVDGEIIQGRLEGFIQTLESGLSIEPNVIGLWIPVSKNSDDGYPIPWISDDLYEQLKFQRNWVDKYIFHPKPWSITEAQGHRNLPPTGNQKKFFPLFPDAAAIRGVDITLPIAKQKIMKLWGELCLEIEKRLNGRAGKRVVTLVRPDSIDNKYPVALYDLHTLRVSGVTDLIERGVPVHIVQECITGHKTPLMTMYYHRPSTHTVRDILQKASENKGATRGHIPFFTQEEIMQVKPQLLSIFPVDTAYTGFDALNENIGLAQIRIDGICPGTRCEEGGIDETGRSIPVPMGDRGPSCPQCRFFLSGPPFLLGQAIEGNKLIFKIRKKTASISEIREKILDADEKKLLREQGLLAGKLDVEERHLNDMLTEWWYRMQIYEKSREKLAEYEASLKNTENLKDSTAIINFEGSLQYDYIESTPIELSYYLSTVAEFLPEEWDTSLSAPQDIEIAIGKFIVMNDADLAKHFFNLTEEERRTTANITMELLLKSSESPQKLQDMLDGKEKFNISPELKSNLSTSILGNKRFIKINSNEFSIKQKIQKK